MIFDLNFRAIYLNNISENLQHFPKGIVLTL
jgi:hypothetical protein